MDICFYLLSYEVTLLRIRLWEKFLVSFWDIYQPTSEHGLLSSYIDLLDSEIINVGSYLNIAGINKVQN